MLRGTFTMVNRLSRRRKAVFPLDSLEVNIGDVRRIILPVGRIARIYMQRNGVDIPGAVSAAGVNYYDYTIVAADAGADISFRVENEGPDTTPPRMDGVSIQVPTPNQIIINYNKTLSTNAIAASQFLLGGTVATGKTITGVQAEGSNVKITFSSNFVPGDLPLLSYTQSATDAVRVKDWAGNLAPNFTDINVWNDFPVPATPAALLTTSTVMQAGGGGFVHNPAVSASQAHILSLQSFDNASNWAIIKSNNGWVEMQVTDTDGAIRSIGVKPSTSAGSTLNELDYTVRVSLGGARAYFDAVAVSNIYTFPDPSPLCRVRIYRDTPSGEIKFDTSEDGAVTWTTRHAWTQIIDPEAETNLWCHSSSTTVACIGVALQGASDRGF